MAATTSQPSIAAGLSIESADQNVALVASVPLNDDGWTPDERRARLIDLLEERGVIGPLEDGERKILKTQ